MNTILNHLTPFIEKEPKENIDLFVCEECENYRRYSIVRYFCKGEVFPWRDDETPFIRLMNLFYGEEVPETGFYRCIRKKTDEGCKQVWVKTSINPLDPSYIVINPEDLN